MGTAIKRPVPDRVKLIFDIRALWRSALPIWQQWASKG